MLNSPKRATDRMNENTKAAQSSNVACRQSGRAVIADIIHRLERKAQHLKTLSGMLPANLTPEQDDALWHVACDIERK